MTEANGAAAVRLTGPDDIVERHPTLAGHARIMRVDHWFKNVFVLPGIVLAWFFFRGEIDSAPLLWRIPVGLLAVSLIASTNYVLNELLDAPYDRLHPLKRNRPVPAGLVDPRLAVVQMVVLGVAGLALSSLLGTRFFVCAAWLLVMGLVYNVRPIRLKDVVFLDVLTESLNNPIRLLIGWYIVVPDAPLPPLSLIMSYWMIGCYFMALKRFAELRAIGDPTVAAMYRRSFGTYTENLLLATVMGYASAAMLFFGAFAVRYRVEWFLAFPLIAAVMAVYLMIGLRSDSPVQAPERLYREPLLVVTCLACAALLVVLTFVDLDWVGEMIEPDLEPQSAAVVTAGWLRA